MIATRFEQLQDKWRITIYVYGKEIYGIDSKERGNKKRESDKEREKKDLHQ